METKQHDDPAFNLWMFLVEVEAVILNKDISHVTECVWQVYFDQNMTPPEAINAVLA